MTACPTVGTHGAFSDYECIDTIHELQSCGGCSSTGAGQDCTAIRGAWNVGCKAGKCTGAFTSIMCVRGLIEWNTCRHWQFTIAWQVTDWQATALPVFRSRSLVLGRRWTTYLRMLYTHLYTHNRLTRDVRPRAFQGLFNIRTILVIVIVISCLYGQYQVT
jgi:hypothetical protein